MALRCVFRGGATVPLEVEGITPDVVAAMSLSEIERLTVYEGNRTARLADFFDVTGDPVDQRMEWDGELAGVHWLGAKMKAGIVRVTGCVGRHVGSEMRGGEIHVEGDAGDWVGGEMHGGLIHVRGTAGHLVGAAYRGSAKGMTRGTILIDGDVGNDRRNVQRQTP
jgi:formylmethanofuran dehydrogenase subunit C